MALAPKHSRPCSQASLWAWIVVQEALGPASHPFPPLQLQLLQLAPPAAAVAGSAPPQLQAPLELAALTRGPSPPQPQLQLLTEAASGSLLPLPLLMVLVELTSGPLLH